MIRDTIDVYLSCIDRKKVQLVFQLWFVSFLTVMAGVAVTASGYEPWNPPTFVVVWLVSFVMLEGLTTAGTAFFSFWLARQRLPPMVYEEREPWTVPHVPDAYWEDPDGFWDDLLDDGGVAHD